MSKSIRHSQRTAVILGISPSDIIEIDELMDSSKAFEATNKHRVLFHHTAGCYYMGKMFGINFDSLDQLRKKYNLPDEFILDYQKQRMIDRATGTELLSVMDKKFVVREIPEHHIMQDFNNKFMPSLSHYLSYMKTAPWMNNGTKPLEFNNDDI